MPGPADVSPEMLADSVARQPEADGVRGAFPALLARAWRLRLAEMIGSRELVPGKPLIVAAVGQELWIYSCKPGLEAGMRLAIFPADLVSPVEGVEPPTFEVGDRRLQITIDWFDVSRITLALMRKP